MDVESIKKPFCGSNTGLLVSARADPTLFHFGGGGFSEVVTQGPQHHREGARLIEVIDQESGFVDAQKRVRPHIPLGMPFGILGGGGQRDEFGRYGFGLAALVR